MDNKQYGKRSVFINVGWKLFERSSSLIITFLIQILLARLLDPAAFGLAAMVTVFVTLSTIFVSGGLSSSLIQKKDADALDFSSLFWVNLLVSSFLYIILFVAAPFISNYFGFSELSLMLRVLSLKLIISAVNSIQTAYISKNMMFRFYFYSTITGKLASGLVGVFIAISGGGAWALVGQALSLILFETIVLWTKVKWKPERKFSITRAKILYSFAWKIMLMTFVEAIRDQTRNMLIGKKYSSEALAYYDKGFLFPTNIVTNISSSLTAVMFPVLSNAQDNKLKALALCRSWLGIFAYSVLPVLVGLILSAESLVSVVLTDKWLPAVPYLQMASLTYIAWIIEIPIRETLKSLGHANTILYLQIVKTVVALLVLITVMNLGVIIIAACGVFLGVFNILISIYYAKMKFRYNFLSVFKDTYQTILLNIFMGVSVYSVSLLPISNLWKLIFQVIIGVLMYIVLSIVMKNKNYKYIIDLFKTILNKKRKSNIK
jgi:O-antigen/teichoic acid export membrane protein